MQEWKQWTSKRMIRECGLFPPVWQAGFFDHILRSAESARRKWDYLSENPVRAGFVECSNEWSWQGEIYMIDKIL
jgi:hypothetical protein